jgi:hypothetical protein
MKAKNFFFLMLLLVMAVSCKQSEDRISDHFIRYYEDTPNGLFCGIKDDRDPADETLIPVTEEYEQIYFCDYFFVGVKSSGYTLLDLNGEKLIQGDSLRFESDYVLIYADKGNADKETYFYTYVGKVCGPADMFYFSPYSSMVGYKNKDGFGVFNILTGESLTTIPYSQLVDAWADDGEDEAFYVGNGKEFYAVTPEGISVAPVAKDDLREMQQEAFENETPWPESGYGIVSVFNLR